MICRHVIIPMGGHFHRICPQIHDRTFIAKIRYSRASSAAPCHFIITTFDCIPTTFDCIPPLLWTFYVTFCWITKSLLLFPMCICVYLCESIICTCIHIFCTDVVCLLHLQYLSKNTRMSFLHLGKENSVTSCLCFNAFCSVLWGVSPVNTNTLYQSCPLPPRSSKRYLRDGERSCLILSRKCLNQESDSTS